jgi:hypothetical protein
MTPLAEKPQGVKRYASIRDDGSQSVTLRSQLLREGEGIIFIRVEARMVGRCLLKDVERRVGVVGIKNRGTAQTLGMFLRDGAEG